MIPQDHGGNYGNASQIFIPRVLPNQRQRFETEDFFRKSAQTSEVNKVKFQRNFDGASFKKAVLFIQQFLRI